MRVAIVGAGAIGCYLGARLFEAGHQVTLIGHLEQVKTINERGLYVSNPDKSGRLYHLPATTELEETPDWVLLTVKTQDVASACRMIRDKVSGIPVVAMQNGIRGDDLAGGILGKENLLGAVIYCAVSYLQHGEIEIQFPGWLKLGEPFTPIQERTHKIARVLNEAVPTFTSKHLEHARWSKLIANLNNGVCAACNLPLSDLVQTRVGQYISLQVMKEGYTIANAAGIKLENSLSALSYRNIRRGPNVAIIAALQAFLPAIVSRIPESLAMKILSRAGSSRLNKLQVYGSTWQSTVRGKTSEIDYLNGEIVALGKSIGLTTPFNSHLVDVIHNQEKTHQFCQLDELIPPSYIRIAHLVSTGKVS